MTTSWLTAAVPDLVEPSPIKAHAATADGLSQCLLQALREDALQDPDLAEAINERRGSTTGKQLTGKQLKVCLVAEAPAQSCSLGDGLRSDSPEEHDRSYFALLAKIAKLEAENGMLLNQLACQKEDVLAYEEVAHELEDDLNIATAENIKNQDTIAVLKANEAESIAVLKANEAQSADTAKRLACVEELIISLRAQGTVGPHAEPNVVQENTSYATQEFREDSIIASFHRRDARMKSSTMNVATMKVVCPLDANIQAVDNSAADISGVGCDSDTEDMVVTSSQEGASGLTAFRLRVHTQHAAVEYRRAVREHLQQSLSRESIQALPRSCLLDLYRTPPEMLDDEVLSEDEEESSLCLTRRKMGWEFRSVSPRSVCSFLI